MINIELLKNYISSRWCHQPTIKSFRLIGRMLEVKFEDGFGEVIEVGKYYDWISNKREEKLDQILK